MVTKNGFTLVEVLVVITISITIMVTVGGIMTSTFKATSISESKEATQEQARIVQSELKRNIFDADSNTFVCPAGVGQSISFDTLSGGHTSLFCDDVSGKVSSESATSGILNLNGDNTTVRNCGGFVSCVLDSNQKVIEVNFSLDLGVTGGASGSQFWQFTSKVVPRM